MATRYRDLQRQSVLQTGLVDTSAVSTAQQLADTFKQFERTASQVGTVLRTRQGEQEGATAGASGDPQLRAGWRALTAYGRAYNNAAEVTYANKLQIDLDADMDRLEAESEADPLAFENKAKAHIGEVLKNVPQTMRPAVELAAQSRYNASFGRVSAQARAKAKSEATASWMEWAPSAIASSVKAMKDLTPEESDLEMARVVADNEARIAALLADNAITPEQAVKMGAAFISDFDEAVSGTAIAGFVDEVMAQARIDAEAGDDAMAELERRTDLDEGQKAEIRKQYREQRNLLEFERSRQYAAEATNLARRLASGEFGRGVLAEGRRLYKLAALSPEEWESINVQEVNNSEKKNGEFAKMEAVRAILNAGGKLDPADKDHREGLDKLFALATENAGMVVGDDRWRATALATTQSTNILPSQAESWARVNMISGDPETAIQAAEFMTRVQEATPRAYPWNDEDKLTIFSTLLTNNVAAGLAPERAYEMAAEAVDPSKTAVRQIREKEYDKAIRKNPNVDSLENALNRDVPFWRSDLRPTPEAQAEYESLVRQFYIESGDLKSARQAAGKQVAANWGETRVNGVREITKYPVEQLGLDPATIRQDLAETVKALGYEGDPATIRLVPVRATDRTRGLTWGLETVDEFGVKDVVRGTNNREIGYTLPSAEGFERMNQKILDELRAEAQAEREIVLERIGSFRESRKDRDLEMMRQ